MSKKCKPGPVSTAPVDSVHLLDQIEAAFAKPPDVANIRHGQRRILQGSRGRRTSLFPSRKNCGSIPLESRLELAYALVLERNPSVIQYRTQSVQIPFGSGEFAIPDFLIKTVHGNYAIHEVKPSKHHLKKEDIARFARIKALLAEMAIEFSIVDATELPTENEVHELLSLYAQGHRRHYTASQIDLAYSLLQREGAKDGGSAHAVLTANALPIELASYLHFHGRLFPNDVSGGGGKHGKQFS